MLVWEMLTEVYGERSGIRDRQRGHDRMVTDPGCDANRLILLLTSLNAQGLGSPGI